MLKRFLASKSQKFQEDTICVIHIIFVLHNPEL